MIAYCIVKRNVTPSSLCVSSSSSRCSAIEMQKNHQASSPGKRRITYAYINAKKYRNTPTMVDRDPCWVGVGCEHWVLAKGQCQPVVHENRGRAVLARRHGAAGG